MTLRDSYRPLRPDLDGFLFAQVGDEVDGMPLSVISALAQLGLDPWEEAGRLAAFGGREAAEQLARLIADLPSHGYHLEDARRIAPGLVSLLPRGPIPAGKPQTRTRRQIQIRPGFWPIAFPKPSQFWIGCLVVAGAALLSVVLNHGLPFGIGSL
jgi:hypothetical protein